MCEKNERVVIDIVYRYDDCGKLCRSEGVWSNARDESMNSPKRERDLNVIYVVVFVSM